MRIVILGAAGFIGGQIARAACAAGHDVHGFRRRPGSLGAVGDLAITWHDGDLAEPASLRAAMQDCAVLYHAAAYYPYADRDIQTAIHKAQREIEAVLEAAQAARVKRVVYTSSLTTIGQPPQGSGRIADEQDGYVSSSVQNAYFEAKWAMEQAALRAADEGLNLVVLIPSAVFGPGDVKPTTGQVLRDLARGRFPISIHAETNFVDVRDVAQAHLRAATVGERGERTIIGGHNLDIDDALRQAAQVAGVRPPLLTLRRETAVRLLGLAGRLPLPIPELVRGLAFWQPLNCDKGRKLFGLTPRPFAETARDTITWFRENGYA
jgi:dihydroflavonol-4-reductase